MYLVFGTYISFRISFPANVTCYISSVCWIRRGKDTPTYVCSPREEKDFAAIASLCSIPLLSFLSFFIFSLSLSFSLPFSCVLLPFYLFHLSFGVSIYLFLSAGNGIAAALPVVPKGIRDARDATSSSSKTTGMLLQRMEARI